MRKCQSATNVGNLCAGVLPWFTYKFPLYYRHTSLDEFSQFFCKNLALFRFEPHSLTISQLRRLGEPFLPKSPISGR